MRPHWLQASSTISSARASSRSKRARNSLPGTLKDPSEVSAALRTGIHCSEDCLQARMTLRMPATPTSPRRTSRRRRKMSKPGSLEGFFLGGFGRTRIFAFHNRSFLVKGEAHQRSPWQEGHGRPGHRGQEEDRGLVNPIEVDVGTEDAQFGSCGMLLPRRRRLRKPPDAWNRTVQEKGRIACREINHKSRARLQEQASRGRAVLLGWSRGCLLPHQSCEGLTCNGVGILLRLYQRLHSGRS